MGSAASVVDMMIFSFLFSVHLLFHHYSTISLRTFGLKLSCLSLTFPPPLPLRLPHPSPSLQFRHPPQISGLLTAPDLHLGHPLPAALGPLKIILGSFSDFSFYNLSRHRRGRHSMAIQTGKGRKGNGWISSESNWSKLNKYKMRNIFPNFVHFGRGMVKIEPLWPVALAKLTAATISATANTPRERRSIRKRCW